MCDLVNWVEEYYKNVLDGTHWNIKIEYDTSFKIKTGSNPILKIAGIRESTALSCTDIFTKLIFFKKTSYILGE